jgi:hypothetical protein
MIQLAQATQLIFSLIAEVHLYPSTRFAELHLRESGRGLQMFPLPKLSSDLGTIETIFTVSVKQFVTQGR